MNIGDRMKNNYELRAKKYLTRRTPVIIRVDGKAFHTFTRSFEKPFSRNLMNAMDNAAKLVSSTLQGFKLGYVQSDEASFLITDYDDLNTEAYFDYSQSKIESVTASQMTGYFNQQLNNNSNFLELGIAFFDCRAFNIPESEITNYFLWRAKDWHRNSVSMYCHSFFSHKELHGKNNQQQHDMLHSIGKNWTKDLTSRQKNGTFISKLGFDTGILPEYEQINELVKQVLN